MDEIRTVLDPWVGKQTWKAGHGRFTLYYRFETTLPPVVRMRVKLEVNTREHFAVEAFTSRLFTVENPWFSGAAEVTTYTLSRLLGTKLRALHQRKKGRDLFDLALGLEHTDVDLDRLVEAFDRNMAHGGTPTTRAQIEASMAAKMEDAAFLGDVVPLLRTGSTYDPHLKPARTCRRSFLQRIRARSELAAARNEAASPCARSAM